MKLILHWLIEGLVLMVFVAKLEKGEIEFLFETIKEARILGKYLPVAMGVVTKLKNQYKLLDRKEYVIKKENECDQYDRKKERS